MARGKEKALRIKLFRELARDLARTHLCREPTSVDVAVIEATDVEEQATIAKVIGCPAVSARPYADLMVMGSCIADRGDDVVGILGLHDHVGKTVRN
jgi:hypothetical protein